MKYMLIACAALTAIGCNNEPAFQPGKKDSTTNDQSSQAEAKINRAIQALQANIAAKNLGYTVGRTSVAGLPLSEITGETILTPRQNDSIQAVLKAIERTKADREQADPYIRVSGTTLLPTQPKLDLREYGLATPVRDQGNAGSCWAFGSMAGYESAYDCMNAGEIDASEQYVINRSGAGTVAHGGLAFKVYLWMVGQRRNVDDEANTPYVQRDATCSAKLPRTNYFATTANTPGC